VRAVALLGCALLSLLLVSGLSLLSMSLVQRRQVIHSQGFVPAKRLTSNFEREILNARIFFIYYVTIQKPGSIENGWKRYREVQSALAQLEALTAKRDDLSALRSPVAKLQSDLDSYGIALTATLDMVKGGVLSGPVYDAQVKEWAARGATLVTDAGNVEKLAFAQSEVDSNRVLTSLEQGKKLILGALLCGFVACLAGAVRLTRSVETEASLEESELSSSLSLIAERKSVAACVP
jgi:hypothetical protein